MGFRGVTAGILQRLGCPINIFLKFKKYLDNHLQDRLFMLPLVKLTLPDHRHPEIIKKEGPIAETLKELFREYEEGKISRWEFMRQAVIMTGSLAAANSLIGSLLPTDSYAAQVAPNDPDVLTHNVKYEGKAGPVAGYLARPMKAGQYPGLLVIHENRRLEDHARDVARRFAKEGYVALASDFLSRQGGTMKANPQGAGLLNIRELAPWQGVAEDAEAGIRYLRVLRKGSLGQDDGVLQEKCKALIDLRFWWEPGLC
jgi:Dienelactone hydrolase family